MFLDMIYHVNVIPPSSKDAMQLIDLVLTLGFYQEPEEKIAYQCTISMIDELCSYLKSKVSTLPTEERVDLAIALMIIPLDPVLDIVAECLTKITLLQFKAICFDLVTSTNYFLDLVNKHLHFIEEGSSSLGLLCRYFVGSKQEVTVEAIGKKIRSITEHIIETRYGINSDKEDNTTWNQLELTTCGKKGPDGPTLEECIEAYNTEWVRDKKLFDVSQDRPGIQKVTIPRNEP